MIPKKSLSDQSISVVINTYNAEEHLEKVVKAVQDFDEVLVCDMESTDHTVEIARRMGCRVVTFPKAHHTIVEPARNFAIQSATSPWVLVVDADGIYTHLQQQGIIVRNRNKVEKCLGCLRITVGTPEENNAVINGIKSYDIK